MRIVFVSVSLFLALATPVSAQEQAPCNAYENVKQLLTKNYGESRVFFGTTTTGGVVEVYGDKKDGSWTIIVTSPKMVSCLIAAGIGWNLVVDDGPNDVRLIVD